MTRDDEAIVLSEADEIAAMLPWYVSGKIGAADRDRVDRYLSEHPGELDHVLLARDEADAVFAANQNIPLPKDALDRLRQSLAGNSRARLHAAKISLIDRISGLFDGLAPRQLAYAGITAALVIAVQAASIGTLLVNRSEPSAGYETASGPTADAARGSFALVSFQPAATAGAIAGFMAENQYVIVDGPKAGGLYRLRISRDVISDADSAAALAKLKSRGDVVAFASLAPASQ